MLVQLQSDNGKRRKRMLEAGAPLELLSSRYHKSLNDMVTSNFVLLTNHYMSYDMWSRPYRVYDLPSVDNIYEQFSSHRFYELTGFWPVQVQEICQNLSLIGDTIVCQSTRCTAPKDLAVFVLLRRWHIAGTWELVAADMRQQRGWCIQIYLAFFQQLKDPYRKCVRVLDFRRIVPLLDTWSDMMVHCTGCEKDVLFFADGKPWQMSRPGKGQAVRELCAAAGTVDYNLMQRAYYNGHYKYHGAKVQHVLQADGMVHSFTCPIRNHDAMVLRSSAMITMLSVLYINDDPNRPVKSVTDKDYGRSLHFRPFHTDAELRMMNPHLRAVAEAMGRSNKKSRLVVEKSFMNQVTKFKFIDCFKKHRIFQNGQSKWSELRCLWDLQTFMFNLFTCSDNCGSPVTGILGIPPPTVAEYLHSCNNNLLVPIPLEDPDDHLAVEAGEYQYYL